MRCFQYSSGRTLLLAFDLSHFISRCQVVPQLLGLGLHHPDVLEGVAMNLFVALMAQHDAIPDGCAQLRESRDGQDVMQLQLLVVERLAAMRAAPSLAIVQLALVYHLPVFCESDIHQVADGALLHPAVRDVEVQTPDA